MSYGAQPIELPSLSTDGSSTLRRARSQADASALGGLFGSLPLRVAKQFKRRCFSRSTVVVDGDHGDQRARG
jgi:hypothetical protein